MRRDEETHRILLEQAKWRVGFLTRMLDSERTLKSLGFGPTDKGKEASYVKRLEAAKSELERLEQA